MSLSQADFTYVSNMVRREAAIVLAPGKEYLVEARLIPVARQVGAADVGAFLAELQRRPNSDHQRRVIDALTTNETSWFRDREPFAALTSTVLPELIKARTATRKLRFWSAASSSGQEAYSLAITMQEELPTGWGFEIVGSDISTEMVKRAQTGEYSQVEVNRGLPASQLVQYFERAGAHWRVVPALRRNVEFRQMNLTVPLPSMPPFDVIFLRNVLIYFDVATKRTVLRNAAKLLRPDGWLFLGAAETTIGIDDNYERVPAGRTSAYRLKSAVPAGAARRGVTSMRAIVIDDSRAMRMILKKIMVKIGYEVWEAADGQEAMNVLADAAEVPDVALIDWNMPNMNGLEFVVAVRADARLRPMTLVMVTTESEHSQIVRALASGAHEYVIKPFTEDAMIEKLALLGLIPTGASS